MQIVIDIPEKYYKKAKEWFDADTELGTVFTAIVNGTPLPKGHGRLIDADALENYIKEDADEWDEYALAYVEDAPTIIKADKENK